MICAIFPLDKINATFYSNFEEMVRPSLEVMLNDFEDDLPEGYCMEVTVDGDDAVVMMDLLSDEGDFHIPISYNTMKAYCDAYGVDMATPEYVGPYSLEVAREVYGRLGDFMTIIPVAETEEVFCAS